MNSADPCGVLVLNKPRGPTSHDVVAKVRRAAATRRVGHAGTLDPMATGVLVTLIGEATKLSPYLTSDDKTYLAEISFGIATRSHDAEGEVISRAEVPDGLLEGPRLTQALDAERQRQEQVPPEVSAIHVDGQRAHERVRRGQEVVLPPRPVSVQSITVLDVEQDAVRLEICVTKGYYVRALARDLGLALGVPAHLSELCRVRSGAFTLDEAVPFPPVAPLTLLPMSDAIRRSLPAVLLTDVGTLRARHGKRVEREHSVADAPWQPGDLALFDPRGHLVAIAQISEGTLEVKRGFIAR